MADQHKCPKCSSMASYSTLGEMYEIKCANCGYEEAGMFLPAMRDFPQAKLVEVLISSGTAIHTADNMYKFARQHKILKQLPASKLNSVFLSRESYSLGLLAIEQAEIFKKEVSSNGFVVEYRILE